MSNSFIIEHDPVTNKWCTHVWITGLHTIEDQYLNEGSNETHDDLDAACARIKAWKEVEVIVNASSALSPPDIEDRRVWGGHDGTWVAALPGEWPTLHTNLHDALRKVSSK
jgi:hypothetical protein